MASRLPDALKSLVDQLGRLPGLGPKSALRVAMALLKWPEGETRKLGQDIYALRDALRLCSRCGGLCSSDPCPICSDQSRDRASLCLVAEWDSLVALEEGCFYNGQYFVLGGLLDPLQKRDSQSLEIDKLLKRLDEGEIKELVLALGATLEGENTASWLKKIVKNRCPAIRITRLAQGIPLGAEVKHMDKETLRQSLRFRQEI